MDSKVTNSMQAKFETEAVETQLFVKLSGKLVAVTTFVKENGKLVPVDLQWK